MPRAQSSSSRAFAVPDLCSSSWSRLLRRLSARLTARASFLRIPHESTPAVSRCRRGAPCAPRPTGLAVTSPRNASAGNGGCPRREARVSGRSSLSTLNRLHPRAPRGQPPDALVPLSPGVRHGDQQTVLRHSAAPSSARAELPPPPHPRPPQQPVIGGLLPRRRLERQAQIGACTRSVGLDSERLLRASFAPPHFDRSETRHALSRGSASAAAGRDAQLRRPRGRSARSLAAEVVIQRLRLRAPQESATSGRVALASPLRADGLPRAQFEPAAQGIAAALSPLPLM